MTANNAFLYNLRGAVEIAYTLPLAPLLRGGYNRWGATPEEEEAEYPGDRFTPEPVLAYTRAITIAAPPGAVWRWVAQIGQGRGGLYSYDGLENLIGCDLHSADCILEDLVPFQPGDPMRMGPEGFPFMYVLAVEPEHYLLMGGGTEIQRPEDVGGIDLTAGPAPGGAHNTWVFYLKPLPGGETRLISRARNQYERSFGANMIWGITEPLNFVMEKAMLRGIKARAERK